MTDEEFLNLTKKVHAVLTKAIMQYSDGFCAMGIPLTTSVQILLQAVEGLLTKMIAAHNDSDELLDVIIMNIRKNLEMYENKHFDSFEEYLNS